MRSALLRLLAGGALALAASGALAFEAKEAKIRAASQQALAQLVALRDGGQLDDASALALIQEVLSPEFDFGYLAGSVMARNWSKATPAQQGQLTDLLQRMIERTYAKSLAKFSSQQLEYLDPVRRKSTVNVAMNIVDGGKKVKLEYSLKEKDGVWKITDLKIENVSLVGNFRRQFGSVVRSDGIDGLIQLLESRF